MHTDFMWNSGKARELLEQRGRTRKWLARECGVDVRSLNNMLLGRKPGLPVIKLMAQALECEEGELLEVSNLSAANE